MPKLTRQEWVVGGPSVRAGTIGWSASTGRGAGKAVATGGAFGAAGLSAAAIVAVDAVPAEVQVRTAVVMVAAVRTVRRTRGLRVRRSSEANTRTRRCQAIPPTIMTKRPDSPPWMGGIVTIAS